MQRRKQLWIKERALPEESPFCLAWLRQRRAHWLREARGWLLRRGVVRVERLFVLRRFVARRFAGFFRPFV